MASIHSAFPSWFSAPSQYVLDVGWVSVKQQADILDGASPCLCGVVDAFGLAATLRSLSSMVPFGTPPFVGVNGEGGGEGGERRKSNAQRRVVGNSPVQQLPTFVVLVILQRRISQDEVPSSKRRVVVTLGG
jgi:hypothetical protein